MITQLILLGTISATNCPQNKYSVDVSKMPYAKKDIHSCQYAGALQVRLKQGEDHNFFYWLFKKTKTKVDAPFIFWLNGGPGATSMMSLFQENGPLRVSQDKQGDYKISKSEKSWEDLPRSAS